MKIKDIVKKIALFLIIFGFISNLGFGQEKNQVTGFAGLNYVMQYGSEADYVQGENDFPVTPAHMPPIFGFSYARFFSERMGVEVDFRYNLSSKVTLEDPSDGDTIDIDTAQHYTITGNLIYQLSTGSFIPYILAGGGIDNLVNAEDQFITSALGYDVTLEAPEKKIDIVVNAGAGVYYFTGSNSGFRFDARYIFIPSTDDHPAINSLNITGGVFYRF